MGWYRYTSHGWNHCEECANTGVLNRGFVRVSWKINLTGTYGKLAMITCTYTRAPWNVLSRIMPIRVTAWASACNGMPQSKDRHENSITHSILDLTYNLVMNQILLTFQSADLRRSSICHNMRGRTYMHASPLTHNPDTRRLSDR